MTVSKDQIAKSINPSTGILYKNPTLGDSVNRADTQSEIVKQVLGSGKRVMTEIFEPDGATGVLPGLKKIRDMSEETLGKFFFTMFRTRPNIFSIHIKLGDYPDTKEIRGSNKLVSAVRITKQTEYKDLAESFAELFADRNLNVVEVLWSVESSSPGNFFVKVTALGTTEDNYSNDEFFSPAIGVEYFPNG